MRDTQFQVGPETGHFPTTKFGVTKSPSFASSLYEHQRKKSQSNGNSENKPARISEEAFKNAEQQSRIYYRALKVTDQLEKYRNEVIRKEQYRSDA